MKEAKFFRVEKEEIETILEKKFGLKACDYKLHEEYRKDGQVGICINMDDYPSSDHPIFRCLMLDDRWDLLSVKRKDYRDDFVLMPDRLFSTEAEMISYNEKKQYAIIAMFVSCEM